ncbi:MAG TPA: hypothetical protein VG757_08110 [Devosia sp.]|nr:hypothetical protein [Devosia sp.]
MRNLTKFVATAAFGAAIVMSGSAPSYAFTDNVKDATSYFFDCLGKLGSDENCGGPHEMNTSTSSIYSGTSHPDGGEPYCGPCYHAVWHHFGGWDCVPDYKTYGRFFRFR